MLLIYVANLLVSVSISIYFCLSDPKGVLAHRIQNMSMPFNSVNVPYFLIDNAHPKLFVTFLAMYR
jgi:hypothetical protein